MSQRPLLFVVMAACLSSSIVPVWSQSRLSGGNRQDAVEALSSERHKRGRQEWRDVAESMSNFRALSRNRTFVASAYVAQNAPEREKPAAAGALRSVDVSIKEWLVPTPGSHPHDPLATTDGAIWYTGQMANLLGRLDPRTGEFKEFRLKTPASGPHGLVADKDGNIWFTANFKGYIGKLDPKTGELSEYPMPNPKARDPHTLVFDQKGTLWFTVQGGNMVGKLVPHTGEVQLATVPTPHANPYGMGVNSKGVPFFAEFGSNKLASIDPDTLQIREYVLPSVESRPRRIAITSDDVIWYSDYGRGALGRFDPKSGEAREWPSPGGPKSGPYGIATVNDIVWYSELGTQPNSLVRFDPKTETFQTWAIPSGGGVVRNMMPTRDGNLVLACSGVNQVAYGIKDGKEAWRAYSMGPDSDMLVDPVRTTELGKPVGKDLSLSSWQGDQWKIGGGTTWGWISFDPELNLIYYGSGNPSTWNPKQRPGDNKWSMTIWARDLDSGMAKWVYQMTPHDEWDYDGVNEMILVDQIIDGKVRRTLVHFDRNGFGYTLDRVTGELLVAEKYDPAVNWATSIDMDKSSNSYGRPRVVAKYSTDHNGEETNTQGICPATVGAKNANPAAYSPLTDLFYVPVTHICMDYEPFHINYTAGQPYTGADTSVYPPSGETEMGRVIAWDAKVGKIVWSKREPFAVASGLLTTAGGVVFYGTLEGYLKVVDARSGKDLYKFKTPSGIIGNVMTYEHRG